ncbi:hypothetical protein TgHK011_003090 [Trichoderma gracile]|nr:hypothetical protein TgHK011_003090 [Trichoderma gracile]
MCMKHGAPEHISQIHLQPVSRPAPPRPPAAGVIITSIASCSPASIRDTVVASASTTCALISVSGTCSSGRSARSSPVQLVLPPAPVLFQPLPGRSHHHRIRPNINRLSRPSLEYEE